MAQLESGGSHLALEEPCWETSHWVSGASASLWAEVLMAMVSDYHFKDVYVANRFIS